MTRTGKIARLPKTIRDELNQRLENGETGGSLADWLNGLPEVQAIMKAHFAGAEIREQNLSEWRKGGYLEWLRHQQAMELAERLYERAEEMKAQAEEQMPMSEVLSLWLAARYAVATEEIASTGSEEGWKQLRQMCGDVARLRRLDQQERRIEQEDERIELQRAEVEIEQERWKEEKEEMRQESRRKDVANFQPVLTDEERAQRIAEIYGRDWRK